jgi:hypothetical protein
MSDEMNLATVEHAHYVLPSTHERNVLPFATSSSPAPPLPETS